MTTNQPPVYIELVTNADGQGEGVHLSDGGMDGYHVSLPHGETELDTKINEEDLAVTKSQQHVVQSNHTALANK